MSKTVKIITKIISVFLVVLMVIEVSPTNALAAFVKEFSGNADASLEETYNESRNFYYDCHSIDVGRAGTLSINDYTLTPSLSFNSIGIDGNIFPVDISMLYNSIGYRFLDEVADYTPTAYGDGWLTSYTMQLCELAYADKTYLALVSPESVILFGQTDFDETDPEDLPEGTTKWVPVSLTDSGVFIYKVTDSVANEDDSLINESPAQYILQTDECVYIFDIYGRAIYSEDIATSTSNSIYYQHTNGLNLEDIAKIVDGVGNEYRFTYTDGQLTKIKCYTSDGTEIIAGDGEEASPLEMNFTYANGRLASAIFPDGEAVTFAYGSTGKLTTVTNIDGYKAEITYTDGYASKLSEYALNENNEYVQGSYIDITWDGNTRTFTSSDGEVQIKTFDDTGKILTIVDGEGNYLYGEPVTEEESSTGIAEEESTDLVAEEETTEEAYTSVCPCSDCTEWECICECESEDVCECIQCKRFTNTVEDESGNVLAEENFDGTKTMKTQNTYTSDGNYLSSSVDTSGNIVYYVYDEAGFLQSMTSGDMEVLFDYDAIGNLTQLSQQVSGLSNGTTMSNQYTYAEDKVTSITHNGFSYNFTYDDWGNQTSIKINDTTYVTYEYEGEEGDRLSEITYADGKTVSYTYNDDGNITGVSYDGGESNVYEYTYDSDGVLTQITDNSSGFVTSYSDTGTQIRTIDGDILLYSAVYNEDGTETENILGSSITYTYNSDYNQVTGKTVATKAFSIAAVIEEESTAYSVEQDVDISVTTDWFGRTERKEITVDTVATDIETEETSEIYVEAEYGYTYDDTDTTASTKIIAHSSSFISESYTNSRTDYYEYDASGNITGIYRYVDGVKTYFYTYVYDEAGQLVRENILEDDKTIIYVYDVGGNIVSKTQYAYTLGEITEDMTPVETDTYTYENEEWKDLLTGYTHTESDDPEDSDNITSALTYDAQGNVTSFNGSTYTWNANRQLVSATTEDGKAFYYFYNENGYLTKLDMYEDSVYEISFIYVWDGDKLVSRSISNFEENIYMTAQTVYDTDGEEIGVVLSESALSAEATAEMGITKGMLLYRKNLQGDITGLIDSSSGQLIGSYTYDAYGMLEVHPVNEKPISALVSGLFIALIPQLYRGYIYTIVGGEVCYYLGSRFYSPRLGRFLNADKHTDTGTGVNGTNMYAYCNNNPVMNTDPTGEIAVATLAKILGIGALPVGAGMAYIKAYNSMLCVRLFQWSFTHRHEDYHYDFSSNRLNTKNWSSFIANKLKKSQVIIDQVKTIIKKMGNKNTYKEYYGDNYYSIISFYNTKNFSTWTLSTDRDLQWSIGSVWAGAVFSIYIKKISRIHYKVYCTLTNEYWDFSNPEFYKGFDKFLVTTGIYLHDIGKTRNFYWGFSVAFNYFV